MLQISRALIVLWLALMVTSAPAANFDDSVPSANLAEDDGTPQGRHRDGSVSWSIEPASGPGTRAGELVVGGNAQIDGALGLRLTIRRSADAAVAASHVVTLEFQPAPGFSGSAIGSVAGILMKAHLGAKPLAARVVKLDANSFRIELADDAAARAQNLQLLADAPWLDVIMTYANGRQAELTLVKGVSGREAFDRALASWK
jgi:hypothetical protein